MGKSSYSQPGYSRKTPGCCALRGVRKPTREQSFGKSSGLGRGTVAHKALRAAIPARIKAGPRTRWKTKALVRRSTAAMQLSLPIAIERAVRFVAGGVLRDTNA